MPDVITDQFTDDSNSTELKLWEDPSGLEDDGVKDRDSHKLNEVTLERKGKTLPLFYDKVILSLAPYLSKKGQESIEKYGTFKYRRSELDKLKFNDAELETKGVCKTLDNVNYIGQWVKNKDIIEGRGIALYPDGTLYQGFWKNNQRNGAGMMIYANGDVYLGTWANDK